MNMETGRGFNEQCITFSQMNLITNSRQIWRTITAWSRAYPVSYTHLDVYKRQDIETSLKDSTIRWTLSQRRLKKHPLSWKRCQKEIWI